mmetsp:Transcript_9254/g.13520  ORF Transcript_9254/g.13520 Transcript_9254/m.13520 type:complete len:100 (-) Transcript_9254:1041-1340(-)
MYVLAPSHYESISLLFIDLCHYHSKSTPSGQDLPQFVFAELHKDHPKFSLPTVYRVTKHERYPKLSKKSKERYRANRDWNSRPTMIDWVTTPIVWVQSR